MSPLSCHHDNRIDWLAVVKASLTSAWTGLPCRLAPHVGG
jgi:hypothetical protein